MACWRESVETDAERSYVRFNLDPRRASPTASRSRRRTSCSPGNCCATKAGPITAPIIPRWPKPSDRRAAVRFDLAGANDRELPLILGLMPVLPKHAINPDSFEETTFEPPVGSGPYVVKEVKPGASVTFARNPNYWGRDLPINRGFWNFDEIRFDFYRDANSYFEAFKKGLYDVRAEHDPSRWQTGYDGPALRAGRSSRKFPDRHAEKISAFVFNTRRPIFADVRVREAIALLFDFEWVNQNIFFGLYRRTPSYFDGSELSSSGGRPMRASASSSPRFPAWCATTSWKANGRRRRRTDRARPRHPQEGADAARAGGFRSASGPSSCETAGPGLPSASKSSPPPGSRSAWRWPSPATSNAPASPRISGRSTRSSLTGAS